MFKILISQDLRVNFKNIMKTFYNPVVYYEYDIKMFIDMLNIELQ